MDRDTGIKLMQDLLRRMVERKGSDLFITAGFPPAIKVDGEIKPQTNQPLTPEQAQQVLHELDASIAIHDASGRRGPMPRA
jgi:twitching motility protein PilU